MFWSSKTSKFAVPNGVHSRMKLTVSSSHINQQIALKTIKKLNFSVNAVWNGQEVLDYLAQEFTPSHPRPDIILMDVQVCAVQA